MQVIMSMNCMYLRRDGAGSAGLCYGNGLSLLGQARYVEDVESRVGFACGNSWVCDAEVRYARLECMLANVWDGHVGRLARYSGFLWSLLRRAR